VADSTHSSDNTYTWEEQPNTEIEDGTGYVDGSNWWDENEILYEIYLQILGEQGGLGRTVQIP
jgi:hypothetical protein